MRKILLFLSFIFLQLLVNGQKEWSNWYSNGSELLTFKNGNAQRVTNFINPVPTYPPYENLLHFYFWGSGGISYSDPATGDLQFIISNRLGFGKNYKDFPNDTFVRSCPDEKSYHIIPFTNDPKKFYVVQFQSVAADLLAQETGLQVRCPNAIGLAYSIVDLNKNGGQGDFTAINRPITRGLTEQITLVRHANGKNVWIIVHPYNTAQYHAILVTDAGFQPPVVSNIGAMVGGGFGGSYGDITATHDGKLLAGSRSIGSNTGNETDIELFDFNNATGMLSNYRTLPTEGHNTKLQFSPDNSKLYTLGYDENYDSNLIVQWDFNQPDVAASRTIVESIRYGNLGHMQLAPDGKIYVSSFQEFKDNNYHTYLLAIQCPNLAQYACNVNRRAIEMSSPAFPDLVNDFINTPRATPASKFSIGNDTAICFGSFTLIAPAGWQSYKWSTGETTQSITVKEAGLYYVLTGNLGFSCPTGYGYINVADKAIKLNLGKDTGLCANTAYPLHISNDYTNILWNNGSHTRDTMVYGGGVIYISANDANGCYTRDTINVYSKYEPRADFGSDTTLCNGESLKLQLLPYRVFSQNAKYLWQDNSTADNFTITSAGKYWATVTYAGCTVSDTINVNYISSEKVSIGKDTSVCMGDSLLLRTSINNAKYQWSTYETTPSIYVKQTGNYSVKVTNGSCTVMDTIEVIFKPKPIFSLGADTSLCRNDVLSLSVNVQGNYLWQDNSTLPKYKVTKEGTYWLKVTQEGCYVTDSIQVLFKELPPLNLGVDTGFCAGTTLRLNAYNPAIRSFIWQDQSSLPYYDVTTGGMYAVKVTGVNGCANRDTINIKQVSLPNFTLGNDTAVCNNTVLPYDFNIASASYLWNEGSTGNKHVINAPGIHSLTVNQQGCAKTDSIIVNYKPTPVVNLGRDTLLCEGVTKILNATNATATYKWQDGSTLSNIAVKKQGLYFVSADIDGCRVTDSIIINYSPKPVFTIVKDTAICRGQHIELKPVVNTAVSYRWQDGSTAPFYNVTDTGRYALSVYNTCGTYSNSVKISVGVCELYLPSAFTPNNDNRNDLFRVKYPFEVRNFSMVVYNRFGGKVFETNDMTKGWNGTLGGVQQNMGTFVWMVSLTEKDGTVKTAKGTVVLLR